MNSWPLLRCWACLYFDFGTYKPSAAAVAVGTTKPAIPTSVHRLERVGSGGGGG